MGIAAIEKEARLVIVHFNRPATIRKHYESFSCFFKGCHIPPISVKFYCIIPTY